jgi:hypothetical protein
MNINFYLFFGVVSAVAAVLDFQSGAMAWGYLMAAVSIYDFAIVLRLQ